MPDRFILGFTLSLDNFRTAVVLGAIRLSWRRSIKVGLVFGFWDGVAPLVGILIGEYLGERIGSTADYVGAAALGVYGLYLVAEAWRTSEPEEPDERWALFGLPLPLSLDNIVAGTSLGLLGYSPWLAPFLFGGSDDARRVAARARGLARRAHSPRPAYGCRTPRGRWQQWLQRGLHA